MFSFLGLLLSASISNPSTESDFTVAHHLSKMSQCQDFPVFTFCPLQCNSISCCALSTAVHHLPNNSCHLLGNAAPRDICPAGVGPPSPLTELSARQRQRCTAPRTDTSLSCHMWHFPSHVAQDCTPAVWSLDQAFYSGGDSSSSPAALPSCPCPPSLHNINPSMPSWLCVLCFMTAGPPPD